MRQWLKVLPEHFGLIEQFNQRYPLRTFKEGGRTLEIGAGMGAHIRYENISKQDYVALEVQSGMTEKVLSLFPGIRAITGDCQEKIDFPDQYFDRVLAIHILEHLPDLPSALLEVKRVLKPDGTFCVIIPCDPGFAYSIARNISARPLFEKLYHQNYDWLIKMEHINTPHEITAELQNHFRVVHRRFFPFNFPIKDINLIIGLTLELL